MVALVDSSLKYGGYPASDSVLAHSFPLRLAHAQLELLWDRLQCWECPCKLWTSSWMCQVWFWAWHLNPLSELPKRIDQLLVDSFSFPCPRHDEEQNWKTGDSASVQICCDSENDRVSAFAQPLDVLSLPFHPRNVWQRCKDQTWISISRSR